MKIEKHSKRHSNRRSGLTLVELIVVVSIIVLLLGVSIPGIVSLASLGRGDFGNSARNLFGALRAAKMYSSTYRSVTAVAYVYTEVYDSVLFAPATNPPESLGVPAIEGFALVRQAVDRQDALRLAQKWRDDEVTITLSLDEIADYFIDNGAYFPLQNPEGQFRVFGRDAMILSLITEEVDMSTPTTTEAGLRDQLGISLIRIIDPQYWFDDDGDDLPDFISPNSVLMTDEPILFPAHVFSSSGPMRVGGAAPERLELELGASPALADAYRFGRELSGTEANPPFEADESGDPLSQAELSAGHRFLEPILIQLYQSTGRVKMASEGM